MFTGSMCLIMNGIYNYSDYRRYIKDYYESNKAVNPAFSYRYLAQKAGVNSSAFFKFIIEGKRNLTKQTILKTCVALKLDDKDAEYFENLVFFNQARTVKEKNYFFDKLIALQKSRNVKRIEEDHYEYFAEWHHCIIRELVTMIDFKEDYSKLARMLKPRITAKQAKDSVELLLKLHFLKKSEGKFVQTEPVVSTGYSIKAHQIIQFQINMLQNAIESFNRCKDSERLNSSTTFGISRKKYAQFIKKIRDFRSNLMEQARLDTNPEVVYQLNLNFFPLSENTAGKKGGIHD